MPAARRCSAAPRVEGRSARRRLRRHRRVERLSRDRPRAERLSGDVAEMLEQLQKDLFAIGARLADPAEKIARTGDQGRRDRCGHSAARRLDRSIRERSCRRCAVSFFPAAIARARSCTSSRTVCRRAERSVVALGSRQGRPPSARVCQSSVRPAVRAGARRQSSRGPAGSGVVAAQHASRGPVSPRRKFFAPVPERRVREWPRTRRGSCAVGRFDGDVPSIARDPVGAILERRRLTALCRVASGATRTQRSASR